MLDIEERLQSIIASMEFEGHTVSKDTIEDCRKILKGELSSEESCHKIIFEYQERL